MHFTKRELLGAFLMLIIIALAFGTWFEFFSAIVTPGVSDIWLSALWFILLMLFFFFGAVVWNRVILKMTGTILMFLPGIWFSYSWEYVMAVLIAAGLTFWSEENIARELKARVHFNFFKSVRTGKFLFILGWSLSFAGGYYVFLKDMPWEELAPRFQVSEELTGTVFRAVGAINTNFAALAEEDVTVDKFLLDIERVQGEASLPVAITAQKQMEQELFLRSGREQIETLFGQPVTGDEKMSAVFSSALQRKISSLFSGSDVTRRFSFQAVPLFLATLVFFTLLPLFSLVSFLCVAAAYLIFRFALLVGWLAIDIIDAKQEKLVE